MKWLLLIPLLLLSGTEGQAQCSSCSGGSCSLSSPFVVPSTPLTYSWIPYPDDSEQVALMWGSQQVGNYHFSDQSFSLLMPSGAWQRGGRSPVNPPVDLAAKYALEHKQAPQQPRPVEPEIRPPGLCKCKKGDRCECGRVCVCVGDGPCRCAEGMGVQDKCTCQGECKCKKKDPDFLTGVVAEKVAPGQTSINGVACKPKTAMETLEGALLDDSTKFHLTIIDSDNSRRTQIRKEIEGSQDSQRFQIQDVNPKASMESWILDCGFTGKDSPNTTLYCQAPNGKVIWRADSYDKETMSIALRKTNPDYDPRKDPELNWHKPILPEPILPPLLPPLLPNPEADVMKWVHANMTIILVVGGLVVLYLLLKKKGN